MKNTKMKDGDILKYLKLNGGMLDLAGVSCSLALLTFCVTIRYTTPYMVMSAILTVYFGWLLVLTIYNQHRYDHYKEIHTYLRLHLIMFTVTFLAVVSVAVYAEILYIPEPIE